MSTWVKKKRARRYDVGSPLFDSPLKSAICMRKVRFGTRRQAKDFARRRGVDQVPYSCEGCGGYHLTTKRRRA